MIEAKTTSEVMMEIASYHLCNGCDETCDFYRNGDCDSKPLNCIWINLHQYFKIEEMKEAEQLKAGGENEN